MPKIPIRRALTAAERRAWRAFGAGAGLAVLWCALLLTAGTVVFGVWPSTPLKPGAGPAFAPFAHLLDLLLSITASGRDAAGIPAGWAGWFSYGLSAIGRLLAVLAA